MKENSIQFQHFILNQQKKFPYAKGDFTILLSDIILASKLISREVNKAGLVDILGIAGYENVQGEQVQKLDIYANETLITILSRNETVGGVASEEMAQPIYFEDHTEAKYCVIFDPLDGSSNIDVNVSIGTIFSIYRLKEEGVCTEESFLKKGRDQVAAGYFLYGSSTMLVFTTGEGVHGFTLDPSIGEYILSHRDIKIPEKSKRIFSVNTGNYRYWDNETQKMIDYFTKETEKAYSMRYIGSLVADFHRNLLNGGIFMYPMDYKIKDKPRGKLRLMYEANPLSFIAEQAGGFGSNGEKNILDILPNDIHQREPLYIGNKEYVEKAIKLLSGSKDE